jgi:hypothetical protein
MPPPYFKTIREEMYYEYAKLISRSAYHSLQRGFITDRFKRLRDGEKTIFKSVQGNSLHFSVWFALPLTPCALRL